MKLQEQNEAMNAITSTCTDTQFLNAVIAGVEIDGNLCSNGAEDWTTILNGPIANDGVGDNTQFTEGASETDWPWTGQEIAGVNTAGDKSDITKIYATQRSVDGNVYAFFGFERATANGTTQFVIELNAEPNSSPNSPSPNRSTGDLRLLIEQGGNNTLTLTRADEWNSTGATTGSWTRLPSTAGFTGIANDKAIGNFDRTGNLVKGAFAEMSLNLTALFGNADCSGNYGTLNVRSSASGDTSSLKDWVKPIALSIPSTCSSVQVDKIWEIDGQSYSHRKQPAGFTAALKLGGRDDAVFGTSYATRSNGSSYEQGQTVTIDETVGALPAGCTNVASGDIGSHTLGAGHNSFTITNKVTCTELTLVKKVVGDASADSWTLTATGPTPLSGATGSTAVTDAGVKPGTYILGETSGIEGYRLTSISCGENHPVSLDEKTVSIAAGDKVTCTLTNTAEVALTVTKTWIVNEVEYPDGEQPVGTAKLTVDGEEAAFGDTITGYVIGDEVAIAETVDDLPALCTLTGTTIDGVEGQTAAHAMTGDPDPNVVKVVNTVDCVQQLTLIKKVDNEEFAGTSTRDDWTLTATGIDHESVSTGKTGDAAVTKAEVPVGSYTLSENGPAGYAAGAWTCEGTGSYADGKLKLELGQEATCTIVNTANPGAVTWTKTDAQSRFLAGSEWELTEPDAGTAVAITDCTEEGCAGPDLDPRAGHFMLEDLKWGNYTLTETLAPPGYKLGENPSIDFTVAGDELQVELAAVVNEQQEGPALPLTGGIGRDHVYLLGGTLLTLGLGALGTRFWTTRRNRTIR